MHLFVLVWAPTLVKTLSEHEGQHGQTLPLGLVFANFMLRFVTIKFAISRSVSYYTNLLRGTSNFVK